MTTVQAPIASPFGLRSTAAEVIEGIDLAGKTAVVTGGYSGLGTETVRALASAGARVIVAARRPDTAAADLEGIAGVTILALDLSDPASIDAFAEKLAGETDAVDILIDNAAVMANPLSRDARGYESQFATNHLGHFQMVARIWPLLAERGARVVSVSSVGHQRGGLSVEDPNFEHRAYDKWDAYGQAKSANALFALELDKRGAASGVRAFSVHPGGIVTPLQRHLTMEEQTKMGWYDADGNINPRFKSVEGGAATSVWAATSPLLEGMGGVYCEDCNIAAIVGPDTPRGVGASPHIRDEALAAALWAKSEEMTGTQFRP